MAMCRQRGRSDMPLFCVGIIDKAIIRFGDISQFVLKIMSISTYRHSHCPLLRWIPHLTLQCL